VLATTLVFGMDVWIALVAVDGFARNFGPSEKTVLGALWLVPILARSIAQISPIPLGVPATLAVFVLILQRSGFYREFSGQTGSSVAFSHAWTTLDAVSDEVVLPDSVAAENPAASSAAVTTATTSPR
jgi:hypothetical protein